MNNKPLIRKKNLLLFFLLACVVIMISCMTTEGILSNSTPSFAVILPSLESTALSVQQTYMAETMGQKQETPTPILQTAKPPVAMPTTEPTEGNGLASMSMTCNPGSAPFNARLITNRVILDGDVHAWFASVHQATNVVTGKERWAGDWDLKTDFQLGWTQENLYLVVSVEDETYRQGVDDPAKTYLGDSIEVLIDANVCADLKDSAMNGDDFHLRISPGYNGVNGERFVYRVKPTPTGEILDIAVATARTSENLTNYEIQIPWRSLGLENPVTGQMFRFALFVSDNDDPQANKQESVISTMLKPLDDSLTPLAWTLVVLRE